MKNMKRRLRKPIKRTLIALAAITYVTAVSWYTKDVQARTVPVLIKQQALPLDFNDEHEATDIIVTNYFLGDGSSGTTTASGYQISDFGVNEEGMYTYLDYIIIATANTTRLEWSLFEDYKSHELYEVLTLSFNGKEYKGIVLDVCGACFGIEGESNQRYDIFTTGPVIGKVDGKLFEK